MTRLLISKSPRIAAQVQAGTFLNANATLPVATDLSPCRKSPQASFIRIGLPLKSDPTLRTRFVNAAGFVRVGRLLEELDAFAGAVALVHCDDGDASFAMPSVVTAGFDRVDLLREVRADEDLEFAGAVTHSGRSSLNIDVELIATEGQELLFTASTTFVARQGVAKGGAVPVPVLVPSSVSEEALARAGALAAAERKARGATSLFRVPPTAEELSVLHELFLEAVGVDVGTAGADEGWARAADQLHKAPRGRGVVFTDATRMTSTLVTMPQDRNIYGKMFGGFLMRAAYEVAWACGWRATGAAPRFSALDAVTFRAPVDVGTLLRLDAQVAYADADKMTVTVDATMSVPGVSGPAETPTNQFSFVFNTPPSHPRFAPRSYAEGLCMLAARRRSIAAAPRSGVNRSRFPSEWWADSTLH
jgi:acyl-coenzyme A thioesterase 9